MNNFDFFNSVSRSAEKIYARKTTLFLLKIEEGLGLKKNLKSRLVPKKF